VKKITKIVVNEILKYSLSEFKLRGGFSTLNIFHRRIKGVSFFHCQVVGNYAANFLAIFAPSRSFKLTKTFISAPHFNPPNFKYLPAL
jgi:hypothetical protein